MKLALGWTQIEFCISSAFNIAVQWNIHTVVKIVNQDYIYLLFYQIKTKNHVFNAIIYWEQTAKCVEYSLEKEKLIHWPSNCISLKVTKSTALVYFAKVISPTYLMTNIPLYKNWISGI